MNTNSKKLRVIRFTEDWKMSSAKENFSPNKRSYYDMEELFGQDFDGSGLIGHHPPVYTVVEGVGNVELIKDQYRYLYVDQDMDSPIQITKKNSKLLKVSNNKSPKWSLIGAETANSQNLLLWKQNASGAIRTWTCNSEWKQVKGGRLFSPGTDGFVQLEDLFSSNF